MGDKGCYWTVWEGNGKTPCVYRKVDAQCKDGYPRRNDRASVVSGSAKSLIETCQPDFQPVIGRPVNHSRLRDRFDKVIGTRPAGSSFLIDLPPGLWEVVGAAGFREPERSWIASAWGRSQADVLRYLECSMPHPFGPSVRLQCLICAAVAYRVESRRVLLPPRHCVH